MHVLCMLVEYMYEIRARVLGELVRHLLHIIQLIASKENLFGFLQSHFSILTKLDEYLKDEICQNTHQHFQSSIAVL